MLDEGGARQDGGASGCEGLLLQALLDMRAVTDNRHIGMSLSEIADHRERIASREIQVDEHAIPWLAGSEYLGGIGRHGQRGSHLCCDRLKL